MPTTLPTTSPYATLNPTQTIARSGKALERYAAEDAAYQLGQGDEERRARLLAFFR